MTDTFIQLPSDSTGKKVRSFENTVGPNEVHSQALTLVDAAGNVMSDLENGAIRTTLAASESGLFDAASRLRVSTPDLLWAGTSHYGTTDPAWRTLTATGGTATHLPNESAVAMATTTANGSRVVRQSAYYVRYTPGMSMMVAGTAVFGAGQANNVARFGLFSDTNGLFFERNGTAFRLVRRSSTSGAPVDDAVAQASWNIDPLDGTGPSGFNLNLTLVNLFVIDLQWLGAGRIRFGVYSEGKIIYCHEMSLGNSLTVPYMTTAHLPVRYEIVNTGATAGANTMKQVCATAYSEDVLITKREPTYTTNRGITTATVTTRRPVLSIRPKLTFNSISNRLQIVLTGIDTVTNSNNGALVELVYGGTLTGAVWADVDTTNSSVERDVTATAIAGGEVIFSQYLPSSANGTAKPTVTFKPEQVRALGLDIGATTGDILSIVCTALSGTENILAAINWRESR